MPFLCTYCGCSYYRINGCRQAFECFGCDDCLKKINGVEWNMIQQSKNFVSRKTAPNKKVNNKPVRCYMCKYMYTRINGISTMGDEWGCDDCLKKEKRMDYIIETGNYQKDRYKDGVDRGDEHGGQGT